MKWLVAILLSVLLVVGVASARYDEYYPINLNWGKPLKIIGTTTIVEDGLYDITFQAQVVNDGGYVGFKKQVMVTAKLAVNEEKVKDWTENIMYERHYGQPTLHKVMYLYAGDIVTVTMRGDCSVPYPKGTLFVLTREDKLQFDVVKIGD